MIARHRLRLCILVSHPIQYFASVYRALASRDDVDLSVFFRTRVGVDAYFDKEFGHAVRWDIPLLDGYSHEFLSQKTELRGVEWAVVGALNRHRPDVLLLHGYSNPTNLVAMVASKCRGVRVLIRGDTRMSSRHMGASYRTLVKRLLFRQVDGFVAIGSANADYYQALGVASTRIHFAPFSVDNAAFALHERRQEARKDLRERLGIAPNAIVVVFASKLILRKRAADLLAALASVCTNHRDAVVVIAGSGPEEPVLRTAAASLGDRAVFVGFQNQSELPALFAASDIFVLPSSEEPWGLVINEAMASGLPVIVSDDVGAAADLVNGKDTGRVFPVGNIEALACCLNELLASRELRERMSRAAETLIANWTPEASAAGIAAAAIAVMK